MVKCPDCRVAPLRTPDAVCRYCDRAKARVTAGRVPMDSVLKTFVVGTVVANAAVFGLRAVLYALDYLAVSDLQNGDLGALDTIHAYGRWMMIDWWATIASAAVVSRLQRRWVDAGNANGLTRPEIGLRWLREMPSGKAFQRWQWAQVFGYLSIILLNFTFHNSATTTKELMIWAVLEVTLCSAVIAASIGGAFSARDVTAQLLEQVALAEHAAGTAHAVDDAVPDPIA